MGSRHEPAPPGDRTADDAVPAHHVTAEDVVNGPRYHVPYHGSVYSQQYLTCLCGWSTVTLRQLTQSHIRVHLAEAERRTAA